MRAKPSIRPSSSAVAVHSVIAAGSLRVPLWEIATLRRDPGPAVGRPVAGARLKHADEQTVLAVAAVLRTVEAAGWSGRDFTDWGVVAAPRFPGRLSLAPWLERFRKRGAASVSPLLIPNLSLHAMAGSISLTLGAHGLNFGVGGGHGHLEEALLCVLTACDEPSTNHLWMVATEWRPEPVPDVAGSSQVASEGIAVVLALAPADAEGAIFRLRLLASDPPSANAIEGVEGLARFLETSALPSGPLNWSCQIPGGPTLVLEPARSAATEPESDEAARALKVA